ncbi:ABC transporter permease [Candidatus Parcubacteria bacterium]|nr:MAG: ABC transporter permease [Candidatus Parcubacteria bacterium]
MKDSILNILIKNSPIILFLTTWEVAGKVANTPLLPSFSQVIVEFFNLLQSGVIVENLSHSFLRVVIGYLIGGLLGIVVGIFMGINRTIELSLRPLISMLLPIPTLGWLPLMMLWIGINEALPIVLIFICAFFPVAYATLLGIKEIPQDYINSAKALGASNSYILFRIILPLASPSIFTGLRLESGMVWKTVLAAEMFAIPTGIGAMMINAESLIRVDVIMVALIILALMSFGFEKTIYALEKAATGKWR